MTFEELADFASTPAFGILVFLFGSIVGSFLNVCIVRLPRDESILRPGSRCPACHTPVRWHDNVPLLGWLWLRGRCRACQATISWRYPLVEGLTGLLFVAVLAERGLGGPALLGCVFVAALVVVTFIDLDHQIIPDEISLPGILVGLGAALAGWGPSILDSLLGVVLGGGILWGVAAGYEWLRGEEGMGGGDIKLLAMIGAFLGWQAVFVTLLLGSLTGAVVGGARILLARAGSADPIPFGPFLAFGALIAMFFGEGLIDWYLGLAAG